MTIVKRPADFIEDAFAAAEKGDVAAAKAAGDKALEAAVLGYADYRDAFAASAAEAVELAEKVVAEDAELAAEAKELFERAYDECNQYNPCDEHGAVTFDASDVAAYIEILIEGNHPRRDELEAAAVAIAEADFA